MDPAFSCLNFSIEATLKKIVHLANKEFREHPKEDYGIILSRIFNEKMADLSFQLPALAYSAGVTTRLDFNNIELSYGIDITKKNNGYYSLEKAPDENYEIEYWVEISTVEPDPNYSPVMRSTPVYEYRSETGFDRRGFRESDQTQRNTVESFDNDQQNEDYGPEWLSYVPVIGSARDAYRDYQTADSWDDYAWAGFNTVMAISDVFLVKSLFVAGGKIIAKTAFKSGSHSWRATRAWLGKTGQASKGQHVHHWLFHQNQGIGKRVPNIIKNQPWNLMRMPIDNPAFHQALHGKGIDAYTNILEIYYYGTPQWVKPLSGYGINSLENLSR